MKEIAHGRVEHSACHSALLHCPRFDGGNWHIDTIGEEVEG